MSNVMTDVDATTSTRSAVHQSYRSVQPISVQGRGPIRKAISIGFAAAAFGTTGSALVGPSPTFLFFDGATSAGQVVAHLRPERPGVKTAAQIAELKDITGLTWDQVSRMFGVDRRSVHYWAQGATMNAANTENLGLVLAQMRQISSVCGAAPEVVRGVLLSVGTDGEPLLHRIVEKSGGKLPASSGLAKPARMVDLGLEQRPSTAPELSLADRLASSTESIPEAQLRPIGRIEAKRKPRE